MEWLERMNHAMDYIESNLTGEIKINEVASRALCSSHEFQRMFSFITNVTLAEYIRRRRITLAALELQHNKHVKVIDVAIKFGYESPVSFARAFQAIHGMTPSMARRGEIPLKPIRAFPFKFQLKEWKQ